MSGLADNLNSLIKDSIVEAKKENSILKLFLRIGLVILVIAFAWLII